MIIIGRYFESNVYYINIMKVCKKYNDLTKIYYYNNIGDCSLFINIEIQHLYNE